MRCREQVPGPQSPSDLHGPASLLPGATSRKAGALGPHSPRRLLQTSPAPHRLPEPGWAPSWGQVGSYCPRWAVWPPAPWQQAGQDRGAWRRAQGSVLGVPSGALWLGRRQRPNCRSQQLPAPTRRPPPTPPDPPPSPATHRPLLVSMVTGQCCSQTSSPGGRQGTPSFCTTPR